MAKRIYHVLLVREDDGVWTVQFGSWDRDDVLVEREAYRDNGVRASALKLVTCDGRQSSINAMVAKLNEAEAKTRLSPIQQGFLASFGEGVAAAKKRSETKRTVIGRRVVNNAWGRSGTIVNVVRADGSTFYHVRLDDGTINEGTWWPAASVTLLKRGA